MEKPECFTNPIFYLLDFQFITKGYNSGTRIAEMHRARYVGGGRKLFQLSPEDLQIAFFGGFLEASLCRHG